VILREGRKPIVLIERTVEMLMLLSDSPPTVGDETIRTWGIRANFGFDPFTDYAVRLQTALHPDIRKYLIGTLDADQIVALMLTVSEGISNGSFTVRDLQKIVRSFGEREIELLGEYSAVRDMGDHTVIRPIKEHCGEEGNPVIEQIIEHMKSISRRLKRKLEIYGVTQNE